MTYKEQLKDPRWQRMQSAVRERDKYKCQLCGDTTTFLHVHHLYYKPNTRAWEYDIESLTTLCSHCHGSVHSSLPKIVSLAIFQLVKQGACIFDIQKELSKSTNIPISDKHLF